MSVTTSVSSLLTCQASFILCPISTLNSQDFSLAQRYISLGNTVTKFKTYNQQSLSNCFEQLQLPTIGNNISSQCDYQGNLLAVSVWICLHQGPKPESFCGFFGQVGVLAVLMTMELNTELIFKSQSKIKPISDCRFSDLYQSLLLNNALGGNVVKIVERKQFSPYRPVGFHSCSCYSSE